MKTSISSLSLLLLIGCHSCQLLDTPLPKTELEKLPPATQEGKGTFGCLVNGKAWFTKSYTNAGGAYQLGHLGIYGIVDIPHLSMGIDLWDIIGRPILTTGSYSLLATAPHNASASVFKSLTCMYGGSSSREDVLSGQLVISKLDKSKYIVSGTFEFTIAHPGCDTLRITDGRFDIPYAP